VPTTAGTGSDVGRAGGNPIPLTKEGSRKLFEAALSGNLAAAAA
jgi:hypothetical protein